jgi:hypothetical protein
MSAEPVTEHAPLPALFVSVEGKAMGGGLLTMMVVLPVLLVLEPFRLIKLYNKHLSQLGPRDAALAEGSHGAAMIVLPVLVLFRFGGVLPPWSSLVVLALIVVGGLRLYNGALFSVGWRDPKLIARGAVKICLAVFVFRAVDARQFGDLLAFAHAVLSLPDLNPLFYALLSLVGWWLLVTGLTKLFLVLRGLPAPPWGGDDFGTPHGNAGFTDPAAAAQGLGSSRGPSRRSP